MIGQILSAPLRALGDTALRVGWALDAAGQQTRDGGDSIADVGFWLWRQIEGLKEDPACECVPRRHVGSDRNGCTHYSA